MQKSKLRKGKKIVLLPDVHLTEKGYHPVYIPVKKFIKDFKPDGIVLMGDFMDCGALSHWNLQKRRKIEGKRWEKELEIADKELQYLEKYTKHIVWIEGNHENWCEQYLDKNPELEGILEISNRLRLKERGITWVKINELYKVGNIYLTHGLYVNDHHAKKHLQKLGCNICYCHTHIPQVYGMNMRMQEPLKAVCLGCLCDMKPAYLKNKQGNWINGFGVLYVADNKEFNLYQIDIISKRFYFNGKRYD